MKTKALITVLLILNILMVTHLLAQPAILWHRSYGDTGYDQATDVLQTTDGGFILTGIAGSPGYLVKTGPNGDTLWTRYLPEGFGKMLQTSDGGFFIASGGSNPLGLALIQTDNQGLVQWQKKYSGYRPYSSETSPFACDLGADSGFVITGTTDTQPLRIFLMKTNSRGDSSWTRTYGGLDNSAGYSVIRTNDNGYAISGNLNGYTCLIKTDSQGNPQWTYIYTDNQNSGGYAIQQTSAGDYIIGGVGWNYPSNFSFQLLKIDNQGNLIWDRNFRNGDRVYRCYDIDQTWDGGIVMVGETSLSGDADTWLLKTSGDGDSLWSVFVGGSDQDICNTVEQIDDGGFILGGRTESFAVTGDCDYWLVRVERQPQVLSTDPQQNALNISPNSSIYITFDDDMDAQSINNSSIIVYGSSSGLHQGNVTYNSQTRSAEFSPSVPFHLGEKVQVIVKDNIKSQNGSTLLNSFVYTFTIKVLKGTALFEVDSLYQTGDSPYYVCLADFDNDGYLDIASSNAGTDNIAIMLNQGNGQYSQPTYFSTTTNLYQIVAQDLDNDGDIDLAVASAVSGLVILKNDGSALFMVDSIYAVGSNSSWISSGDYDGDGLIDLVVGNSSTTSGITFFMNAGNGKLKKTDTYESSDIQDICTADFDGDGDLDVACSTNYYANPCTVYILLNTGRGKFGPAPLINTVTHAMGIASGDVDGDRDQDLIVVNRDNPGGVAIHFNDGSGTFGPPNNINTNSQCISTFACDLDGDGDLDFPVSNNMLHGNIFILKNNGQGLLNMAGVFSTDTSWTWGVYAGDLDNDGDMDIVTSSWAGNALTVMLNKNTPQILSVSPAQNSLNVQANANISATFEIDMDAESFTDSTFIVYARSTGIHQGQISYDSQTRTATFDPVNDFVAGEVVTAVLTTGILSVQGLGLENSQVWSFTIETGQGPAIFSSDSTYQVGSHPISVFGADLNSDGNPDLAIANEDSNSVSVLFNNGEGSLGPESNFPTGRVPKSVYAADFDNDGDMDLATANAVSANISLLYNNGSGNFIVDSIDVSGLQPNWIFGADFNGDGFSDLATANTGSHNISVFLNDGNGTFLADSVYEVINDPWSVFAADFDNDGDFDITTASYQANSIRVLFNNGDGIFVLDSIYGVYGCQSVIAADLNGDSYVDLATVNNDLDRVSVLLNAGNGTFGVQSLYPVGGFPVDISSADFDGDGDLDLATSNLGSQDISVLLNNGDATFAAQIQYPVNDPYGVYSADFDTDGDLDIAVTNWSTNAVTLLMNREVVGLETSKDLIPKQFALHQNYPNPFNPVTFINYDLPKKERVEIIIYNALGEIVKTLVSKDQVPGYHTAVWDATNNFGSKVSSGLYFYRLQAGEFISTKKLLLLK